MDAYDSAYPLNKATRITKITVNRNEYEPEFSESKYDINIADDYPLITEIQRIVATDQDGVRLEKICFTRVHFLGVFS